MKVRTLSVAEYLIIIVLASVPLFTSFPYRVNIFLSWEGAYRLSQGQLPYRDFGTPLGGMYWVIPAIFFKIFGPQLITLVKAQVFINIIAGVSFRAILKNLDVNYGIRFVAVLLFCISYSFFNFWPWYNHSVIVYELVCLAFICRYIKYHRERTAVIWLVLAALFNVFSLLTKQDGGGMTLLIGCALLACHGFLEKKWKALLLYAGSFALIFVIIILPFINHGFGYWFNHGQPPHTARLSVMDISNEFFISSQWIKFYLFLAALFLVIRYRSLMEFFQDKKKVMFTLLTLAILVEAAIFQETSYTPPDNNIFFHSFAIAFLLSVVPAPSHLKFESTKMVVTCSLGVLLWWSGTFWKYIQRFLGTGSAVHGITYSETGENIVNKQNYMLATDTSSVPEHTWTYSKLPAFKNVKMPPQTVAGIERLMQMDIVKNNRNIKVLNMTELTPLAVEMPYELEQNGELPLWYHLGVGMFNKQAEIYEGRIINNYYDLVMYEYMPRNNNFYPFRVRDTLRTHYELIDSFHAPRRGSSDSFIEIYVPRAH
jgi:hypothetical protein